MPKRNAEDEDHHGDVVGDVVGDLVSCWRVFAPPPLLDGGLSMSPLSSAVSSDDDFKEEDDVYTEDESVTRDFEVCQARHVYAAYAANAHTYAVDA